MNLKILFLIIVYYTVFSLVLLLGGTLFTEELGYSGGLRLNQTGELTDAEIDTGGFFNTGIDFGRFFMLITLGIGLPSTFPAWFMLFFAFWQSIITILTVGFVINSIWSGG